VSAHSKATEAAQFVERPELVSPWLEMAAKMGMPRHLIRNLRIGSLGSCNVTVAEEAGRWHLSISHPWRLPTWDEINAARDALIPADIWLCQPMPPKAFWLNLHPYCLHLWEVRDRPLLLQWASDGAEDDPEPVVDAFLNSRGGT
jgi:hypothetical protein